MSVIAFKIYEDKAQVAFDGRCLSGDTIESENYIKAYKISDSLTNNHVDSGSNLFSSSENQTAFKQNLYSPHDKLSLLSDF